MDAIVPPDDAMQAWQVDRNRRFGLIARHMDMVCSYSISALEASRRGEKGALEWHLRQVRTELMEALKMFRSLEERMDFFTRNP